MFQTASFMANTTGLGSVQSWPTYLSPSGLVYYCLAWAAQDVVSNDVPDPVMTEWYIFRETVKGNDVEYYGAISTTLGISLGTFLKSDLLKVPYIVIEEDVRTLQQLQPPPHWCRVS